MNCQTLYKIKPSFFKFSFRIFFFSFKPEIHPIGPEVIGGMLKSNFLQVSSHFSLQIEVSLGRFDFPNLFGMRSLFYFTRNYLWEFLTVTIDR